MTCRSCEANADLLLKYTQMKQERDELLVFLNAIHDVVDDGTGAWTGRSTLGKAARLKEKYDALIAEREDVFL